MEKDEKRIAYSGAASYSYILNNFYIGGVSAF